MKLCFSWHDLQEVDVHIYRHLRENVMGGFDEERFSPRLGFAALKRCATWTALLAGRVVRSAD